VKHAVRVGGAAACVLLLRLELLTRESRVHHRVRHCTVGARLRERAKIRLRTMTSSEERWRYSRRDLLLVGRESTLLLSRSLTALSTSTSFFWLTCAFFSSASYFVHMIRSSVVFCCRSVLTFGATFNLLSSLCLVNRLLHCGVCIHALRGVQMLMRMRVRATAWARVRLGVRDVMVFLHVERGRVEVVRTTRTTMCRWLAVVSFLLRVAYLLIQARLPKRITKCIVVSTLLSDIGTLAFSHLWTMRRTRSRVAIAMRRNLMLGTLLVWIVVFTLARRRVGRVRSGAMQSTQKRERVRGSGGLQSVNRCGCTTAFIVCRTPTAAAAAALTVDAEIAQRDHQSITAAETATATATESLTTVVTALLFLSFFTTTATTHTTAFAEHTLDVHIGE
jgi:hypothetical protein